MKLKRVPEGYATLDGRFQIERQDGETDCDHPLCYQLHERFRNKDGVHVVAYVSWHVWDVEHDDYADVPEVEYETKRAAERALTRLLEREAASA